LTLAPLRLAGGELLARSGDIRVEDGYAFAAGAAARSGAAYMRIVNDGAADDRLLAVRTRAAERAELHAQTTEEGISRMRPVEGGIVVPAGGSVELRNGWLHVMLMGLTSPLQDGGAVEATLVFENAGEVAVSLPVDLDRLETAGHAGH
jgi:copper(I)-binding protein